MTTVNDLVTECMGAIGEPDSRGAMREVLDRAVANRDLADALGPPAAGLTVLYNAPDLTVLNVVWPPLFTLFPHDHRMWAAIGVYGGREDNSFYRRGTGTLIPSGGKELLEGDVQLLGDDVIHAVSNPGRSYTGAIHVYGGDFIATPRSQWDAATLEEQPYDLEAVRGEFDRAEKEFNAGQD
jgi:predicted metal-dependent enzyme (double-stranded beta helix superfamily)